MSARSNRRTALRHMRRLKVPCSLKQVIAGEPIEVAIALATATAVRLGSSCAFPVGAYLAVDLPDEHGRVAGQPLRVTLCRQHGDSGWTIEGSFVRPLAAPTVHIMQVRAAGGWKTQCRQTQVHREGPWLATMQDVSRSGLGLILERSFDPGTFLEIALPSIRRRHLQPKMVRVTYARRLAEGADWLLGAEFLRALTEQELQVLL